MTTQVGSSQQVPQPGQTGGGFLERRFRLRERGSSVGTEVRGGVVTFLTMLYIVVLNPLIMGFTPDSTGHYLGGGTAPNSGSVAAATALVACIMSVSMGLVANFPLAMATGLGLNAFLTFGVVPSMTWPEAMGLVVIEGVLTVVLVLTGLREAVLHAVPQSLKLAISAGIGMFIAFIGFWDAGIVRTGSGVPVQLGSDGTLSGWPTLVFVVGLLLIFVLWARKVKGAILIGIVVATLLAVVIEAVANVGSQTDSNGDLVNPNGWGLNVPSWPDSAFSKPDFSTVFHISFGAFGNIGVLAASIIVFTLLLSDFFDTMGTMTAIGAEAGLNDAQGIPPNAKAILTVDAAGAAVGGLGGVSSSTSYIESASGVGEGARTGLSSVVVGLLFLVAMFFTPLVTIVPFEAATPALVLVGFLMLSQARHIEWDDVSLAIPAFLTIVVMPFTYSITNGVGAGFISFVVLKLAVGKARDIHPLMWGVSVAFVAYFMLDPLKSWMGIG